MSKPKPYQDVMVTISARVYDEDDYGNAQALLGGAVRKAWAETHGNPSAANGCELLPSAERSVVIRVVEIGPLSGLEHQRVRFVPHPQQFRFVPKTAEEE